MTRYKIWKGRHGESMAVQYLTDRGQQILHQNWKAGRREVDIIAHKDGVLHFIEVKTRYTSSFGVPEKAVTASKLHSLHQVAEAYLDEHPQWKRICFDVIAIEWQAGAATIRYFEDVS